MKSIVTEREHQILTLLAEGMSSKEIADKLALSFHTVQTHRKNILRKLNEPNTLRAVAKAGAVGLLPKHGLHSDYFIRPMNTIDEQTSIPNLSPLENTGQKIG